MRQTGQVGVFLSALWIQKLQKRCPHEVVTWFFTRDSLREWCNLVLYFCNHSLEMNALLTWYRGWTRGKFCTLLQPDSLWWLEIRVARPQRAMGTRWGLLQWSSWAWGPPRWRCRPRRRRHFHPPPSLTTALSRKRPRSASGFLLEVGNVPNW